MDNDQSKPTTKIYNGFAALPADPFWSLINTKVPPGSPSPFAQRIAAKQEVEASAPQTPRL